MGGEPTLRIIMNILAKITEFVKRRQKDIFLGICMVLVAVIGFSLGRINSKTPAKTPAADIYQETAKTPPVPTKTKPIQPKDLRVVASKSSTSKKYHFTWCPGAKKIKEANKLWFSTEADAQKAGYTIAGNCN